MSIQANRKYLIGEREYSHEDLALLSVAVACEKKAVNPVILDLRNLSTAFTELFTIVSAANNRQVYAIAEEIRMFFKNSFGLNPVAVDGMETCTWVLIDYGFMFVHIFQEPTRDLYRLEELWSKARSISAEEEVFMPLYQSVLPLSTTLSHSE
ncbi:MAG: ribosome silencing factor [Bdellovibrionota bacterium]